jgi:hypothetical protein
VTTMTVDYLARKTDDTLQQVVTNYATFSGFEGMSKGDAAENYADVLT